MLMDLADCHNHLLSVCLLPQPSSRSPGDACQQAQSHHGSTGPMPILSLQPTAMHTTTLVRQGASPASGLSPLTSPWTHNHTVI